MLMLYIYICLIRRVMIRFVGSPLTFIYVMNVAFPFHIIVLNGWIVMHEYMSVKGMGYAQFSLTLNDYFKLFILRMN